MSYLNRFSCLFVFATFITGTGCGGRVIDQYGIEESTGIILGGKNLIGSVVTINDVERSPIVQNDLHKTVGVFGVKKETGESLQKVFIEIVPGQTNISVEIDGREVVNRDTFLSYGQIMEVIVK